MEAFKKKIENLCSFINRKWIKYQRSLTRFKQYNNEWLEGETNFIIGRKCKRGRPQLSYSEASDRLKRKLASDVSLEQQNDPMLLVHAASNAARSANEPDLRFVLKESLKSPTRPSKIKKMIVSTTKSPIALSAEEALVFLLENNLSKQQYVNMRLLNKARNCDIYPAYNKLIECKLHCRPEGITNCETSAEVPLQKLVDHTAKRILLLQKEVIEQLSDINEATLIFSYGFDGSTGQSMFKQMFNENTPESFDQSLFVTSIIPLKLISFSNQIIWLNRTPQSIRFCRPIKIEYVKETKEHILAEKKN